MLGESTDAQGVKHYSVLYQEVLDYLNPQPGQQMLDCTVGGAGHSQGLLTQLGPTGYLWGIERDPRTYSLAVDRLNQLGYPYRLMLGNFSDLETLSRQYDIPKLDGILLDLGTSLFQLKDASRGFSFMYEGPLDMRMNPQEATPSAADLVNTLSEQELADLFYRYGEERQSRRIARELVRARRVTPFSTTTQLAEQVARCMPRGKIHPATRVFQALRIAVNGELEALEHVLPVSLDLLKPGGRLAVISFHSLEDRLVKHYFREQARDCVCPPRQPMCTCEHRAVGRLVFNKAVQPSDAEVAENPPSRSARLRVIEKL